jgi:hypothetical protein
MRILVSVLGLSVILVACASSSTDSGQDQGQSESTDDALKVCTKMPLYCPTGCFYQGGGCPQQCHCPNYVACGPTLHCPASQQCCTAGPVNVDPSLNTYLCATAGTACPL